MAHLRIGKVLENFNKKNCYLFVKKICDTHRDVVLNLLKETTLKQMQKTTTYVVGPSPNYYIYNITPPSKTQ